MLLGTIINEIGVPISGVASTSAQGALSPADVVGLTGLSATSNVGSPEVSDAQIFDINGVVATSAVGSTTRVYPPPLTETNPSFCSVSIASRIAGLPNP